MSFNFSLDATCKDDRPCDPPPQVPVSIIDIEHRMAGVYDMDLHMSDPCPKCGAFSMLVGDYVCWGTCLHCYEEALAEVPH
jgi:hypothetical protein